MTHLNLMLLSERNKYLIQNTICELSSNNYVKHDDVYLLNKDGKIINSNNMARLSGLTNGCRVVLI